MSSVVAIHQPQYLPYLGFFHKIRNCDLFVALDHVQFQKNGLQNRNKIKTSSPQGWQWLTVPVRHGFGQAINQMQIDSTSGWSRKHFASLKNNYSKAPFWREYEPELDELYKREYANLSELNMAFTAWILKVLGINTPVVYSSGLNVKGEASELLVDICRTTGSTRYLSGPGGRNYMDLDLFTQAGIEILWQQFDSPEYVQQFPTIGFMKDLSAIDAVLNCGPETANFLTHQAVSVR